MLLPRLRIRLRGLMLLVVLAAILCLIGFAPEIARRRAAARREAFIERKLRQIFSDRGLAILRDANEVEVYRVHETTEDLAIPDLVAVGPRKRGGREWAQWFGCLLLEGERYLVAVGGDDPANYVIRLRRGNETLVVAVSAYGILHISVDLIDAENQVRHVSFLTDSYDSIGRNSPSLTTELNCFLSD